VQVGKETESDHGVLQVLEEQLEVQAEVQMVKQSLQRVQIDLSECILQPEYIPGDYPATGLSWSMNTSQ